jgi:hypothetical protein
VVLDGLRIVPQEIIRVSEGTVDEALLGREVRTAAASALAARSCAAMPRQSAAPSSCSSIFNTRIWSAVGFAAVRVSARAVAKHSPLCPAFHALVWQEQRERERVGERATVRHLRVCVYVCARTRICACAHATYSLVQSHL